MKLFKIKKSKIDKNGLYANCNIKKGTKVIEYKGKVITRREAEINPKYDLQEYLAQKYGDLAIHVSLTDTEKHTIASVIIEKS